jgi:flagellar FliL protein
MSDAAEPKPKKKGGMKKLLLIGGGAILLLGGGVGAGLYASGAGLAGAGVPVEHEDPNKPKLVLKEGVEEPSDAHHKGRAKAGSDDAAIDTTKYQATYYPIEDSFTSNLRDSDGFVQLGIGVSTFYDQRVIENLKKNEMPVRSAVLLTLADQDAFVITTPEGKKLLQKALKDSINDVLKSREGFGGVNDVYFTSFIIQ